MRMVITHELSSYAGSKSYSKLAYGLEKQELKPNVLPTEPTDPVPQCQLFSGLYLQYVHTSCVT